MVIGWLFRIKFWQIAIAAIALIVAGGYAITKFFEAMDKELNIIEDHN